MDSLGVVGRIGGTFEVLAVGPNRGNSALVRELARCERTGALQSAISREAHVCPGNQCVQPATPRDRKASEEFKPAPCCVVVSKTIARHTTDGRRLESQHGC